MQWWRKGGGTAAQRWRAGAAVGPAAHRRRSGGPTMAERRRRNGGVPVVRTWRNSGAIVAQRWHSEDAMAGATRRVANATRAAKHAECRSTSSGGAAASRAMVVSIGGVVLGWLGGVAAGVAPPGAHPPPPGGHPATCLRSMAARSGARPRRGAPLACVVPAGRDATAAALSARRIAYVWSLVSRWASAGGGVAARGLSVVWAMASA